MKTALQTRPKQALPIAPKLAPQMPVDDVESAYHRLLETMAPDGRRELGLLLLSDTALSVGAL